MNAPNFTAVLDEIRAIQAEDAEADARHAARLQAVIDRANDASGVDTFAAALAIDQIGQAFSPDLIVLLGALAESIKKHNMHHAIRRDLFDDIEGWILTLDDDMKANREWGGE